MSEAMVISSILSWVVILILSIVVYALARQIGVLHERLKPVGALSLGSSLDVGSTAPTFELKSLNGGGVKLGGAHADGKATLLFFLSPTCPVCKVLLPSLLSLKKSESWLELVFASDGDANEHQAFIETHNIGDYPYLLSTELGMAYQIGKLPYGVMIDAGGTIASHGLINNREHLESLFTAMEQSPQASDSVEIYQPNNSKA